jgi:hypothetical protein
MYTESIFIESNLQILLSDLCQEGQDVFDVNHSLQVMQMDKTKKPVLMATLQHIKDAKWNKHPEFKSFIDRLKQGGSEALLPPTFSNRVVRCDSEHRHVVQQLLVVLYLQLEDFEIVLAGHCHVWS